jgi:hypothetical protein
MGSLNPHGRYVHVYLNGEYWGNYNCKEVLNEAFLSDYLGGESEDYVGVKGNANQGSDFPLGVGDPPNPEPWERVLEHRGSFEAVSPYLDVNHYIDFMLLWGYGKSESEFRACGPKEAGSGYKFWINDPDGFLRVISDDRITTKRGPGSIWTALLGENHPDFKMLLADRIYKHFFNDGAMTPAACDARLAARMDEIRDSYLAESARWDYLTPDEWETKAAEIRSDMFPYRADELVAQWRAAGYLPSFDPPTFNQYGGAVMAGFQPVLTSSAGTIYYTLDGTDPRLAGGGISPAASVWGPGAVSVTEDVTITTRVRTSSGDWSALADPRFLLGSRTSPMAGELVISEIHYNPDGPDDYEFIEIWNRGSNLLDLSGVTISNAVRYIFPDFATLNPGAHLVVVEDAVAFSNRYQDAASPWYRDGIDVAGEWVGGLSDGGERIDIMSASNTLISSVRYRSDGDWPERPDGGGSSLELSSPTSVPADLEDQVAYFDDGRSWTASSLYHGSPGRFDAGSVDVVINEVLAHTDVGVDWIEFYNAGTASADLSNMAITDTLDLPARYLIPNGTSIDGQDYLTVSAADLKFGFSELGSDAYLLELSGTNIIRIVDSVSFPAVEREEPFGRYLRSDGVVDFTELIAITPGAPNALPRVGPVVISEIMFVPEPGRSEYVEIMNISDAAVPLYDPAIPANAWAFSGAGDFTFPEGTVLEPSEIALLCATNPAAFRSQYGVDEAVQVFGPWTGGLAAEGEKLQLLTPGDPEFDGFVPMYRADRVSYRTNSFWAVANTGGIGLERSPLTGYGNDPANWRAAQVVGIPGASSVKITFNNLEGRGVLTNFPAMVKLTPANTDSYAGFLGSDGYELRFWNDSALTEELNYEIEHFDRGGDSTIWVQVPELTQNSTIWASWGDPAYTDQAAYTTNGAVWDVNYGGVWHLDEMTESTSGQYHGTDAGTASVAGRIGGGRDFVRAEQDSISLPAEAFSGIDATDEVTLSVWTYGDPAVLPQNTTLFRGQAGASRELSAHVPWGGSIYWDAFGFDRINKGAATGEYEGQWNHWGFVKNSAAGTQAIYLNGALWHSGGGTETYTQVTSFLLGGSSATTENWDGTMDEFRVSNIARSPDWIWASWISQGENHDSFAAYGPVITAAGNEPRISIALDGSGADVVISWTPEDAGWILQETDNMQSNWVDSVSGSENPATNPAVEAAMFYRLKQE